MRQSELLCAGASAAEEIAARLLRVDVAKALDPLRPRDFVVILERIARRVNTAVVGEEAKAMAAALDALDVRWASMSETQVSKIVKGANEILRNKLVASVPPALNGVLEIEGPPLVARTRASAVKRYGLSIGADLSTRDKKAEKNVRKLTVNYVRDEMGVRSEQVSESARVIVERGLRRGHDSITIGRRLRAELGAQVSKGRGYWRMVANSFGGHARSFTQIGALTDARFEEWMFDAVLDEATSDICRYFHGRTFPMAAAAKHVQRVTDLEDPEDVSEVSPWVRQGTDDDGNSYLFVRRGERQHRIAGIRRSGIGAIDDTGDFDEIEGTAGLMRLGTMMPPLHGNCRSNVVPV